MPNKLIVWDALNAHPTLWRYEPIERSDYELFFRNSRSYG